LHPIIHGIDIAAVAEQRYQAGDELSASQVARVALLISQFH
jgi:hypothetical protein